MKKEIAVWSFFAAMLAAALINVRGIERLTENVSRLAALSSEAAAAGDWDSAERFASEALSEWKSRGAYTRLVLRHSAIESAENAIIAMLTEVLARDSARARGAAETVRRGMESIAEAERISLGSVL